MFERYTEKARRVIFFARTEASQFGSHCIEAEHLLLGLVREDKALTSRFLHSPDAVQSIRPQIEAHTVIGERVSTSVDMPLSKECQHVLEYAGEEADRLSDKHIGTEHLLVGLLREEKSFAAAILLERGLRLEMVREKLAKPTPTTPHRDAVDRAASGVAIEFLEGETLVSGTAIFDGIVPAVGDEIVFESGTEAPRSYRVVNVAFVYGQKVADAAPQDVLQEDAPQSLTRIVVKVKRTGMNSGRGWAAET